MANTSPRVVIFILSVGCMGSGIALLLCGFSYWVIFLTAVGAIGHAMLFFTRRSYQDDSGQTLRLRTGWLTALLSIDVGALVATLLGFYFYVKPSIYLTLLTMEVVAAVALLGTIVYIFRAAHTEAEDQSEVPPPSLDAPEDLGLIQISAPGEQVDMQPLNVKNAGIFFKNNPTARLDRMPYGLYMLSVGEQSSTNQMLTKYTNFYFHKAHSGPHLLHTYHLTPRQKQVFDRAKAQVLKEKHESDKQQVFERLSPYSICLDQVLILKQWVGVTIIILGIDRNSKNLSSLDRSVPDRSVFLGISLKPSAMGLAEQDLCIEVGDGGDIDELGIASYFLPSRSAALQLKEIATQIKKVPEEKTAEKNIFDVIAKMGGNAVIVQSESNILQVTITQVPCKLLCDETGVIDQSRYQCFLYLTRKYELEITDEGDSSPGLATIRFPLSKEAAITQATKQWEELANICKEYKVSLQYTSATNNYVATFPEFGVVLGSFFSRLKKANILTLGQEVNFNSSRDVTLSFKPNPLFAEILYAAFEKEDLVPRSQLLATSSRISFAPPTLSVGDPVLNPNPFPN